MPEDIVAQHHLLPEMKLLETRRAGSGGLEFVVEMTSKYEVCPRCATRSSSVYDRRWVTIRDEPIRRGEVRLRILKRRFSCGEHSGQPDQSFRALDQESERSDGWFRLFG